MIFLFFFLVKVFSIPLNEILVLKQLYDETNGENWRWRPVAIGGERWNFSDNTNPNPCNTNGSTWQGITCSKPPALCSSPTSLTCTVTSISLEFYRLKGPLLSNWTSFSTLTTLNFQKNQLTGTLPQYLPITLIYLDFGRNFFSGSIVSEYGSLISLSTLVLEENQLNKSIPSSLGNLRNLSYLALGFNGLTQSIPSEFGQLTKLTYLTMTLCKLTGSLPNTLRFLTSLATLDLSFNSLTSSIPTGIGEMISLATLILDNNLFSSSIPSTLVQLSSLVRLSLATNALLGPISFLNDKLIQLTFLSIGYNYLTGPFPPLNGYTNLTYINVDTNYLTSQIPTELGMISLVTVFSLYNNQFTGPIPSSLGGLFTVSQFDLSRNLLTGTLPSSVGGLRMVVDFSVRDNLLTGPIPSEIGLLEYLESLSFPGNLFTSTLPCSIQNLTRLSVIVCDYNQLTGLCPNLILPPSLEIVDLSDNSISGSLSKNFFSAVKNLQIIDMENNLLSGVIPLLDTLTTVYRINLANNHLSGPIPTSIGSLNQLHQLILGSNHLTGSLNDWLGHATNLSLVNLDISANRIEGDIIENIFNLPLLQTLALTSNCFEGTLPAVMCSAQNLRILSMDGLGSGTGCPNEVTLPFLSDVNLNYQRISSKIPDCVWKMSNLTTLSLSGNRLHGTIGDLSPNSSLINLTLSHNHLSGTIPRNIQNHVFQSLDLSYNKFTGEYSVISILDQDRLLLNKTSRRLILEVNRLSGNFPHIPSKLSTSLTSSTSSRFILDALNGNIFSCSYIPNSDVDSDSYRCGSRSLDEPLLGLVVIFSLLILLLAIFFIASHIHTSSPPSSSPSSTPSSTFMRSFDLFLREIIGKFQSLGNSLSLYLRPSQTLPKQSVVSLSLSKAINQFSELNRFVLGLMVASLLCIFPVYILRITHSNYSTHTHLYRWSWTTAYLTGVIPAGILLISWGLIVCILIYAVRRFMWGIRSSHHTNSNLFGNENSPHYTLFWILLGQNIFFITVNIGVMGLVNALYIISIDLELSPTNILLIQISMALFKASWNKVCLPFFGFSKQSYRLRIFILVLNSIFIPCIATAFTSPSCFQELIQTPQDIVSFYYYLTCKVFIVLDGNFQCLTQQIIRVDVPPFLPSFTYNYLCGSTLLSSYLPIYFYLYLIQILSPIGSYLLCQYVSYDSLSPSIRSNLPGLLWPLYWLKLNESDLKEELNQLKKSNEQKSDDHEKAVPSPALLLKVDTVANKFMHDVLVMTTFGLCCPPLCLTISFSMIVSILDINIMVGRFIIMRTSSFETINDKEHENGNENDDRLESQQQQQQQQHMLTSITTKSHHSSLSSDISFIMLEQILTDIGPACRNLVWIVIWSSCFFFIFLCWDIAGDEVGLEKSLWVPFVPIGYVMILYFYSAIHPLTDQSNNDNDNDSVTNISEIISSLHDQHKQQPISTNSHVTKFLEQES